MSETRPTPLTIKLGAVIAAVSGALSVAVSLLVLTSGQPETVTTIRCLFHTAFGIAALVLAYGAFMGGARRALALGIMFATMFVLGFVVMIIQGGAGADIQMGLRIPAAVLLLRGALDLRAARTEVQ